MKLVNNRIVLDLNKVQWANFYYRQQDGITLPYYQRFSTVRGVLVDDVDLAFPHKDFPNETTYQRAFRLGILDKWTPVLHLQLTANHSLKYEGDRAVELWAAWRAKIFGKK